ncbi:MAG: beta-galactosidase [Armatimonadia bacterium]
MRVTILLMLCSLVWVQAATAQPVDGELLRTPGCDLDADGNGMPDDWSTSDKQIKWQEKVYLSKDYEIVSVPKAYVLATQDLTLKPGQQYNLRITARGTGGANLGALIMHGPQRPQREMSLLWNVEPAEKYEDYVVTFTAPNPACRLFLYNVSKTGTVFYDKVSLREGSPDQLIIQQLSLRKIDQALNEPPATRHLPYARPLAGGPLKAFITLRSIRNYREALELGQRLELDMDVLDTGYNGDQAVSFTGRQAMKRLEDSYYEVYVVASKLTKPAAKLIRQKVEAGAGLVVIEGFGQVGALMDAGQLQKAPDTHYVLSGVPWDLMPEKVLQSVQVGQLGKGRVVRLNVPIDMGRVWGLIPVDLNLDAWLSRQFAYWEWWLSLIARSAQWAARGEPAVTMSCKETDPLKVRLQVAGAPAGAKADVIYRSSQEFRFDEPDLRLPAQEVPLAADGSLELRAPQGFPAAAPTLAEVMVRNPQGQTLCWGSYPISRIYQAKLTSVATDKQTYWPGQVVKVTAKVECHITPVDLSVEAKLIDAFGRDVATVRGKVVDGMAQVALPLSHPICVQHRAFVRLLAGGKEQDTRWVPVRVPELGQKLAAEDYVATTWGPGAMCPLVMEYFGDRTRDLDLNSEFAINGYLAGEHGMLGAGYSGGGGAFREEPHAGDVRRKCLSDPAVVAEYTKAAKETAAKQMIEGPYAVGITDEAFLSYHNERQELCFSPFCQERFRKWLQVRYPSLEALNAQWGTNYGAWDEVKGIKTEEARARENASQFVDFRTFMTDVWVDACRTITDAYHEVAPGIPMGHTNTFGVNPFNGNDYWKLATQTGFGWGQEYSEAIKDGGNKAIFDLWRSFVETPEARQSRLPQREPFFNYGWVGYDRTAQAAHYEPWWLALHGSRGVSYFATVALDAPRGTSWSLVHPTLSLTGYSKAVQEALPDLREGVGKLLMDYSRQQPQVALLWSHPSMLVAWCESQSDEPGDPSERPGVDAYGSWFASAFHFRQHLNNLQLDYQYVTPDQILKSDILKSYPMLILPFTIAADEALVAKLEQYVQDGGMLVGDLRCLRTDAHGKPEAGTALQRLFGVSRTGKPDYGPTTLKFTAQAEGIDLSGRKLALYGREGLEATGAQALAAHATGEPAVLWQRHGKGLSLYLNFNLPRYDGGVRELLRQVVERAGVRRGLTVEQLSGDTPPRAYELNTFTRGPITVYGLIRDFRRVEDSDPVRVNFGQTAHVYDMRARKYLGQVASTQLALPPGDTALYACLPYSVSAMRVTVPAKLAPGGELAVAAKLTADGKPGDHVFHVELISPQGQAVWQYRTNHLAPAGTLNVRLPLALNEARGQWTVKVRDVLTGVEGEGKVRVE